MEKGFPSHRIAIILVITLVIILGYQNCSDLRLQRHAASPTSVLTTTSPFPEATKPPPPPPPPPGASPSVSDGGTSTGAVNLGLTLIYRVFDSIEWSPSGHFVATGPCSPTHQVGTNGWPGGQFLFDRNGNYLAMAHVCRESGYSGACPDGGCNLGNALSFISSDTFVRFAQSTDTPGDQRAPMLYQIQNNRFRFKGQLFTPRLRNTVEENYPNDYWGINGTVVGDTLIMLKSKGRTPLVPPGTFSQPPYRQGFYRINASSTSAPFEFILDWPDFSPQTIDPAFSVGSIVISTEGKAYRFANNTFTYVRDLVPMSPADGYQNYGAKDSTDPNVFYLRPRLAMNNLRKYRYQNNTIVDAGEIVAGPNEYVVAASGNIVLKRKAFENDSRNCPQRSEMIVEVNGQRVPTPTLTWDLNQVGNEICELGPPTGACANYVPLPIPGPQCRSEGAKGAAISPNGVILYVELLTQRVRILKVHNN